MEKLVGKHILEVCRDIILKVRPKSILDVGCGEARLWRGYGYGGRHDVRDPRVKEWELDWNPRIVLLDLDAYKHPLPTVQANAINLPFKDKSFDMVISTEVIEHVPDVEKYAEEIVRVGRSYIITTPTKFTKITERDWENNPWRINLLKKVPDSVYPHHAHIRVLTESELSRLFPKSKIMLVESLDSEVPHYLLIGGEIEDSYSCNSVPAMQD